ncbi:DUF2163 domain-containing protein [Pseudomonas citronellolis]|uniref:DUF2163 domain-containing protein n=1 Tax=Pseudomonas citronellolis TaxID=53408 RepID=UPI000718A43E|nr:DUF2163 domain-containing protein [Pseudomonas citronellolis]KRV72628.1 hypothetical protein AO742_18510 [Pseudomonas citronellolis]KRW77718.1 hypothetical protein AO738_04090 [Pseudomonas citronellolis]
MKPHVADWKTRVYCARIVAENGTIVRLAAYPTDLVMSNGTVYSTESGYEFSGLDATDSMSPSSVDLTGILDHGITREQLATGVFDNARCYVFATSWKAPIEDEEPLGVMILGKTTLTDDAYKAEMMSIVDALNQSVGAVFTAQCPYTLFDQTLDGRIIASTRSRCTGPRSNPDGPNINDYKVSGTVTGVTSQYTFTDASRAEADDWFTAGQVMFTTGLNAGLKPQQIKSSTSAGVITTHEPFPYAIAPGDAYVMIPGCRKRLMEDCVGKYNNGLNNGAQPHMPTSSESGAVGRGA